MVEDPKEYDGKTVMLKGVFMTGENKMTGQEVKLCVVSDETSCCSTYLEFELPEGADYPEPNSKITLSGEFETYKLASNTYGKLVNAAVTQ